MSNFNVQTSHPLIQREQTFVLDRKLISVHSVDRDYQKWPNSNNFGVDLGEAFHNIQSMRLINFAVPSNNYTFSAAYQNTKMSFTYEVNYPFILAGFLGGSFTSEWAMMYEILEALFNSPPALPSDVRFQYFTDGGAVAPLTPLTWTDQDPTLAAPPGLIPPNWQGIARLVWTPSQFSITIPEGSYSPTNLAETIETLMNKAVYNASAIVGYDFLPGPPLSSPLTDVSNVTISATTTDSHWTRGTGVAPFVVYYNEVTNKMLFGVRNGKFTLDFAKQEIYDPTCDVNKAIFHQYTKWGLPSYLGFDKKNYSSTVVDISSGDAYQQNVVGGLYLPFEPNNPWLTFDGRYLSVWGGSTLFTYPGPYNWTTVTGEVLVGTTDDTSAIIKNLVAWTGAEFNLDINGEDAIYMQIDRYNSIDEIYPYSERTGHLYNNDLGYRVNGSFAKIPLTHTPFGQEMGSRNNFVLNVFHSDPPIQRIDRLKFEFRFHDGRLVDFKNLPFSFTLEFNMLKDEQARGKVVRVPPLYNL